MKIVKKPWGAEKQFVLNRNCSVKILVVKPHQESSLQKHKKRTEHWYFLTEGFIQSGKNKKKFKKDQKTIIKKNQVHRIISKDKEVMVLEISFGDFDPKDIVRLEDKYGRK